MNIKATIIERKLRKAAGTPGELYMADQLVKAAKELVVALHEDKVAEGKQQLTQQATELVAKMQQLAAQIRENTQKDSDEAVTTTKREMNAILQRVERLTEAFITIVDGKRAKVEAKLADIEQNVDAYRGEKGEPGAPGKPGEPGKNGSPDTPEEVVAKVNQVGGVKLTAIAGLSEELRKNRREAAAGKGGGMGNTQHETYPVGSGTTTVTLTYSPANGGRAIWLHYQGQYMVYGTHYTVSDRLVTLLFTPVDGTYLDILYIR